ncbi:protocatechuate 3,4-dioxygenase [Maritimibacter sp. 55A14]|uniref:dioxygenase family protein n=1 Tax=Maritimibacter sp. 55A14 TaxID=2174844 RepID=UPI000D60E6ED|nr:protocatechuate 3,4-dioxygenase [Maritimibacter sp. 55A14]PWE33156.1 protocatechuate 3,4-dioxygenase [Maritimibacter sp. 55A14]
MANRSRRFILSRAAGAAAISLIPARLAAATRTPEATEGPFYPPPAMQLRDTDNNLVRVAGAVRAAGGEVVRLAGRVLDRRGRPVSGARVEIWQCDVNGRYLHRRDRGGRMRDAAFQGFGQMVTGADGAYVFTTIKPVPYPGRTPHIHVKLFAGDQVVTTQFYIADDPRNRADGIYRRLTPAEREAVAMRFEMRDGLPEARVDLRL